MNSGHQPVLFVEGYLLGILVLTLNDMENGIKPTDNILFVVGFLVFIVFLTVVRIKKSR